MYNELNLEKVSEMEQSLVMTDLSVPKNAKKVFTELIQLLSTSLEYHLF
jgi:uncharacterized protein (UPF0147 family)